ncbi:MAG: glycosyltransferase family 2 protein [Planctomycetota bacterium]
MRTQEHSHRTAVGVSIAAYNASHYVGAAVESVLAQTCDHWQAIVIDDGSSDDTAEVARAAAAGDPRVQIVSQPNAGRSHARNRGESLLDDATRYVLFLDADDLLEPAALATLSGYLDENPRVACVGCQFSPIDEAGDPIPADKLHREKAYRTRWVPGALGLTRELRPDEVFTPFITFFTGSGVGPHALYRREVFQSVGGYDTRFDGREDHDLFMRVSLDATIHYLPDRLYRYRLHAEQSTKNHEKFRAESRLINDKWDRFVPDERQAPLLRAARAYRDLVHLPLRQMRGGIRLASRGRWASGLRESLAGGARFVWRWPYYLSRWHGEVVRHLSEPIEARRP